MGSSRMPSKKEKSVVPIVPLKKTAGVMNPRLPVFLFSGGTEVFFFYYNFLRSHGIIPIYDEGKRRARSYRPGLINAER